MSRTDMRAAQHSHQEDGELRPEVLLFVFDEMETARDARDELIRSGFAPERVRHEATEGEAGPAEGNFIVGSGRGPDGSPRAGLTVGRDARYEPNFERVATPSAQLLIVETANDPERVRADELVRARGGRRR